MLVSIYVINSKYKTSIINELQEGILLNRRITEILEIEYSDIFFNTYINEEEIEILNKDSRILGIILKETNLLSDNIDSSRIQENTFIDDYIYVECYINYVY